MKTLIVNADDLGLTLGVNRGVADAARRGIVTSTSIMVSAPYISEAIDLLDKEEVSIGLGLHVVLTGDLPTFSKSSRFTSPNGYLPMAEWDASDEAEFISEIDYEVRSQFQAFEKLTGRMPDHMDSHHNIVFKHPLLKRVTFDVLSELSIPIRDPAKTDWFSKPPSYKPQDPLSVELRAERMRVVRTLRDFRGKGANIETLLRTLRGIPAGGIYELMCHVGYSDETLMRVSSYNTLREVELNVLMLPVVRQVIEEEGINLTTYGEAFSRTPK